MRFNVEIRKSGNSYAGSVTRGDSTYRRELSGLKLGPDAEVEIKGEKYTLSQLMEAFVTYHELDLELAFDERGQLEIGEHLFKEVFGWVEPQERVRLRECRVEVRIISEDENITCLPWVLLADGGIFLSVLGWSVALSPSADLKDVELPPSPKVLLVTPQPQLDASGDQLEPTNADAHVEELEEMLSGADHLHTLGKNLLRVSTWEEFIREVNDFKPCVVYYYGHGVGDRHSSRLLFARDGEEQAFEVPAANFANIMRQMPGGPPLLVYVNCCAGDSGGAMGAGRQLNDFIPAVITNSTLAETDAARAQALALWRSILLCADPPHSAVASLRGSTGRPHAGRQTHTLADVRWMTPVLYSRYGEWSASRPNPPSRLERDPDWRFKLDRLKQFSQVSYETYTMLKEQKPRSLAYIWYGTHGQGVEIFHQRLKLEIQKLYSTAFLYEVLPAWPMHTQDLGTAFRHVLQEAFGVGNWHHIPGRIRTEGKGVAGRQTLVYVRHTPVDSPHVMNPKTLKSYLYWWDEAFTQMLEQSASFGLLGVSFVVKKPSEFRDRLDEYIGSLDFDSLVFRVLDEMGHLTRKDISDFLKTHNIRLPFRRKDKIIDRIVRDSDGEYEKVLESLQQLEETHWDTTADDGPPAPDKRSDVFSY